MKVVWKDKIIGLKPQKHVDVHTHDSRGDESSDPSDLIKTTPLGS